MKRSPLKIIPARPKDLLDAETIVLRYGKRLDRKYLEKWARRLCEEAEEMKIWTVLQKTPFRQKNHLKFRKRSFVEFAVCL